VLADETPADGGEHLHDATRLFDHGPAADRAMGTALRKNRLIEIGQVRNTDRPTRNVPTAGALIRQREVCDRRPNPVPKTRTRLTVLAGATSALGRRGSD